MATPEAFDLAYHQAQDDLFRSIQRGERSASSVPLRQQYVDQARCLTLMYLLQAPITQLIHERVIAHLQAAESGHYFFPPDTLHLTIKNVRKAAVVPNFREAEIHAAQQALSSVQEALSPIRFNLKGLIGFSTSVAVKAYASANYPHVIRTLDTALKQAGLCDDKSYVSSEVFFGNITVCRFTRPPSDAFLRLVHDMADAPLGQLEVKTAQLVACDEVCSAASRIVHQTVKFGLA